VKKAYKQDHDGMYTWGGVVKPGKKLRVRGDDCPDGRPYASLDSAPVALNVVSKGKGFGAEATIPAATAPGKHKFYAGCDAGSSGTQKLNVLDPEDTDEAAARQAFGPRPFATWPCGWSVRGSGPAGGQRRSYDPSPFQPRIAPPHHDYRSH
jgi:hypothetical protein